MSSYQPQSTFEEGSSSVSPITLQSIHDMQSEMLRQMNAFRGDMTTFHWDIKISSRYD